MYKLVIFHILAIILFSIKAYLQFIIGDFIWVGVSVLILMINIWCLKMIMMGEV